jgi:conjugative relaxase-like TrwC/TraI family protein
MAFMRVVGGSGGSGTAHYFENDGGYFAKDRTEQGEIQDSKWLGEFAKSMDLDGGVKAHDFEIAMSKHNPTTGESFGAGGGRPTDSGGNRSGFEFVFSMPKSFDVAGLADPKISEMHDKAVATAADKIQDMAQARVTKDGKTSKVDTGNIAAATFKHETSRADDPNTHTHVVVLNATEVNGKTYSIHADKFFNNQNEIKAEYYKSLSDQAKEAGYSVRDEPGKGGTHPEINGVSKEASQAFSSRSEAIQSRIQEIGGVVSPKMDAVAALQTRPEKSGLGSAELKEGWLEKAKAVGVDFGALKGNEASSSQRPEQRHEQNRESAPMYSATQYSLEAGKAKELSNSRAEPLTSAEHKGGQVTLSSSFHEKVSLTSSGEQKEQGKFTYDKGAERNLPDGTKLTALSGSDGKFSQYLVSKDGADVGTAKSAFVGKDGETKLTDFKPFNKLDMAGDKATLNGKEMDVVGKQEIGGITVSKLQGEGGQTAYAFHDKQGQAVGVSDSLKSGTGFGRDRDADIAKEETRGFKSVQEVSRETSGLNGKEQLVVKDSAFQNEKKYDLGEKHQRPDGAVSQEMKSGNRTVGYAVSKDGEDIGTSKTQDGAVTSHKSVEVSGNKVTFEGKNYQSTGREKDIGNGTKACEIKAKDGEKAHLVVKDDKVLGVSKGLAPEHKQERNTPKVDKVVSQAHGTTGINFNKGPTLGSSFKNSGLEKEVVFKTAGAEIHGKMRESRTLKDGSQARSVYDKNNKFVGTAISKNGKIEAFTKSRLVANPKDAAKKDWDKKAEQSKKQTYVTSKKGIFSSSKMYSRQTSISGKHTIGWRKVGAVERGAVAATKLAAGAAKLVLGVAAKIAAYGIKSAYESVKASGYEKSGMDKRDAAVAAARDTIKSGVAQQAGSLVVAAAKEVAKLLVSPVNDKGFGKVGDSKEMVGKPQVQRDQISQAFGKARDGLFEGAGREKSFPKQDKPAQAQPDQAQDKPVQPAQDKPAQAQPDQAQDKPVQPAQDKPAQAQPERAQPERSQPERGQPEREPVQPKQEHSQVQPEREAVKPEQEQAQPTHGQPEQVQPEREAVQPEQGQTQPAESQSEQAPPEQGKQEQDQPRQHEQALPEREPVQPEHDRDQDRDQGINRDASVKVEPEHNDQALPEQAKPEQEQPERETVQHERDQSEREQSQPEQAQAEQVQSEPGQIESELGQIEKSQSEQNQLEQVQPELAQSSEVSFGEAFENAAGALISHIQTGLGLQEVGDSSERGKSFENESVGKNESGGKDADSAVEKSSGSDAGR